MSEAQRLRSRVAAFAKHGEVEKLAAARRDLAELKLRQAADDVRARVGLPPLADDLAAVVTTVVLREAA